jgi:hypothetical protein
MYLPSARLPLILALAKPKATNELYARNFLALVSFLLPKAMARRTIELAEPTMILMGCAA